MITRLQKQCYVVTTDFTYLKDKHGNEYGWGVAVYSTPEKFLGKKFRDAVYEIEVENRTGAQKGVKELYVNGAKVDGNLVPMAKAGEKVVVKAIM